MMVPPSQAVPSMICMTRTRRKRGMHAENPVMSRLHANLSAIASSSHLAIVFGNSDVVEQRPYAALLERMARHRLISIVLRTGCTGCLYQGSC